MEDPATAARRAELLAWIAKTRATQKKLAVVLGAGLAVSIGLLIVNATIGGVGIAITALVALCGFWITAGHIMDWRSKIGNLGKPKVLRVSGGGKRF